MNTKIKRTEEEIKLFINLLKFQKKTVYRINSAIEALEKRYTTDQCWDRLESEGEDDIDHFGDWDYEQVNYAEDAVKWLEGDNEGWHNLLDTFQNEYDVEEIAKIINLPVQEWKGNCYGVAMACVEKGVVKGKARYGQFLGYIAEDGFFKGAGCHQHGWVDIEDGNVFDPTRWVFENAKPYIHTGYNNGEYDLGANKLKELLNIRAKVAPQFDDKKSLITIKNNETLPIIQNYLGDTRNSNIFSINQIHWLANENPTNLGENAKAIFQALIEVDCDALIPIDNYELIME